MSDDFELKHITIDPQPPPPSLSIIFITGLEANQNSICEAFCHDFGFYHLSIPTYLKFLQTIGHAEGQNEHNTTQKQQALGLLHHKAFDAMMEKQQPIPAFLLVSMLHRKIDEEVRNGHHRFLVEGLGDDMEVWAKFAEKIAVPSAIFSFHTTDKMLDVVSESKIAVEEFYQLITLNVQESPIARVTYENLLAAIAQKALVED